MVRGLLTAALPLLLGAQQSQNPSPMVENARAHPRLKEEKPAGRREKLAMGTLYVPAKVSGRARLPLFVHFHGGEWLPEVAAAKWGKAATIGIQLGSGSSVYAKPFADPEAFGRLLAEAESRSGSRFDSIWLTAWSAGYGAVREILRQDRYYRQVEGVLLIDGLHTGYVGGKPGPKQSALETEGLEIFLRFARDAAAGSKRMLVTHSEIFPGTFASTTETADWLLSQLGLTRRPVLRWGPMGTQQLSEARRGRFLLVGYAGNSAPDHVDQLHSLPSLLGVLRGL